MKSGSAAEEEGGGAACRVRRAVLGLYDDCLKEEDRLALAAAAGLGLEQELAVARVLVRRAILDGSPPREVAQLLNCLAGLLKTQHVVAGKSAQQLDEALAAALDAVAAEMGVGL